MPGKPRQSNFELLRLLSMLAIVAGHLFTEGHLIAHATPGTLLPCLLLGSGARVATNLFVLLGCWFLVGATLPMLAQKVGFDPAVMASPFITTIVDALSLLVYFQFTKMILQL